MLMLTSLGAAAWPFTIDDAFIVARYAARIAHGLGYTHSAGPATDGVTGPLWLVPLVLAAWLGLEPVQVAKWLSLGAGAFALALVVARTNRVARGDRAAWIATAVSVSSLPFVVWSVAGLETGLAALCASALALSVTARPAPRGTLAGVLLGLLVWLRPELVPFGATLCAALWLRAPRASGRALLIGACFVLLVGLFRALMFDHVWPMAASAKPAILANGVHYVLAALSRPRAWLLALLLACAWHAGGSAVRVLTVALAVHVLSIVLVGGDWMPGYRLFAPVVPVLALALGLGLRVFALRRAWLVLLLGLPWLLVSGLELTAELRAIRAASEAQKRGILALSEPICAAPGAVALVDLGAVSVACPAQSFLDLGGLTEPAIAYAHGGHLDKHVDEAWLRARAPALVVLHSRERPRVDEHGNLRWFAGYPVERRVLSFAFLRAYRVERVIAYSERYFYVLLVPRGTPSEAVGAPHSRPH